MTVICSLNSHPSSTCAWISSPLSSSPRSAYNYPSYSLHFFLTFFILLFVGLGFGKMRSSIIFPAITGFLLVCYIAYLAYFLINVNSHDFPSYEECGSWSCGNSIIQYPFGTCGLLYSYCADNQPNLYFKYYYSFSGRVVGNITNSSYSTRTLQIAPGQITPPFFSNTLEINDFSRKYDWLITGRIFNVSKGYIIGTIVNCTQQEDLLQVMKFDFTVIDCTETNSHCIFLPTIGFRYEKCTCYPLIIPGNDKYNISADKNFERLQQTGFQITWSIPEDCHSCLATGGRCYSDYSDVCICANDDAHLGNCHGVELNTFWSLLFPGGFTYEGRTSLSFTAGKLLIFKTDPFVNFLIFYIFDILIPLLFPVLFFIQSAAFIIAVVSCISFHRRCCCKRTASGEEQTILEFMDPLDSTTPSVENFLHYYSSQVPARYSYTQLRVYTNNLAEQLGKGGFGTVYKGKLPSGRMIAVKILDESKQSVQQFIAEVATVGTTYHVNLVRMLGYCSEGSKRALVYEYIVNGSLDKYIHGNHQDQLDWKQLYSIAIGTAKGILYLHEECRNRILHCDIKPHNVLLDVNFLPKVADFGLAKISKREESHISAAHGGTLGYAAPEMWSRVYGPVTDKCDVYSYGMLIMEMVGGRKNIDLHNIESRSSQFFYAEWAFKQVQKGEFENLRKGHISEEDQSIAKRLSLIGLWCIQFHASRRPQMSKVIQMLEGNVEITTPPFPFPVDTPPVIQSFSSDQSSSSQQCSSSHALHLQMRNPEITVETPLSVQLSSLDQSSSSNQCSSTYALEVQMIDNKIT